MKGLHRASRARVLGVASVFLQLSATKLADAEESLEESMVATTETGVREATETGVREATETGVRKASTPGSGGRKTSLEELLQFAERNAPMLKIANRRRGYGNAAREGASPFLRSNPTLEFGAGPRFDSRGGRNHDLHAGLEQPVEIAGQRGLRLEAAARLRIQLEEETTATRWAIRRLVVLAYRDAVVARERVQVAESLVRFSAELLTIARRRERAGDVGLIAVRLAETDAAQSQKAKVLAAQELRTAQLTLCEVTGWPTESPPLPRAGLDGPRPVPPIEVVMALASEGHPELRARRAAVAEAHARVELEDRESWPTPTLGVQFAREGKLYEPENYIVLGRIGLPLPLWQRNQGERARTRNDEAVARAEEDATARILRVRVARAHSDLRAAAERLQLFTTRVAPSLENSLDLLRRGFEAGEIPIFEVALARERFLEARRDSLSAYADYYRSLAELESAMGVALATSSDHPEASR